MKNHFVKVRLLFLLLFLLPPFSLLAQNLQVHFINVGQGDSILITSPANKSILIDAGDKLAGKAVTDYLLEKHIKNLDIVIETHQDNDHIGGMAKVVEKFPISLYLVSGFEKNTQTSKKLSELIGEKEIRVQKAKAGQHYKLDGADIEILFPSEPLIKKLRTGTPWNANSVVAKLTYKNVSFLFPGDAEEETEKRLLKEHSKENLKADILKIAHHGGKHSTIQEFIDVVNPKTAIISVGKNTYGHPGNETIKRLKEKGVAIYRTDYSGNIIIETDGKTYEVIVQKKHEAAANKKPRAPPNYFAKLK